MCCQWENKYVYGKLLKRFPTRILGIGFIQNQVDVGIVGINLFGFQNGKSNYSGFTPDERVNGKILTGFYIFL